MLQQSLSLTDKVPAIVETEYQAPDIRVESHPDDALMVLIARGDVAAFGDLVERNSARLYRVAYRLLWDAHEAEDAVQDCFTRLWQNAPGWDQRGGGLLTWLHRVVVNLCLDRMRRFRIVADGLPELEDDSPGPERQLAIRGLEHVIEQALGRLPHRHRVALVLCYIEGMSNRLAAEVLGLHIKALESLLVRARRSLREQVEQMGVSAEDLELLA